MKTSLFSLSALLPLLATQINAHATFQEFWVGSTDMVGTCVRLPFNNSPVTSVTSTDIACNANSAASPGYCSVAAGGAVSVEMHQQPGDRTCTTEAIGGNHDGPVIVYMAKVDNALTADGSAANWFKVAELGLISTDYWGTDYLNANCGKFTFNVPSCLPAGEYLVRAEVIALHVASSVGGAQFYMSCFTIKVTGGGSTLPSSTVKFPGAYSATDPGIKFDLYSAYSSYTIPGPAVWTCASGGTSVATSSTRTSSGGSSSTRTTSTSSATPGAQLYGQCGGQGWTGPTTCASGTCTVLNPYYSQCVP